MSPPRDRKTPTPFVPDRYRAPSAEDLERELEAERRQSQQLKIVLTAFKELKTRIAAQEAKELSRPSQPPVKGPSDPKFWIAILTGVLGTGGLGMAIENWRTPPPKLPADIALREAELKEQAVEIKALKDQVKELQVVVHGMRDFNLATFEKLHVSFPQYRDDLNRSMVPFTEVNRDRVKWFDSHRSYPSLKNQP